MSRPAKSHGSQRRLLDWLQSDSQRLSLAVADSSEPRIGHPGFEWLDAGASARPGGGGPSSARHSRSSGGHRLPLERAARCRSRVRSEFWPTTGNVPNWDLIGRRETPAGPEWLLVEAKAHLRELDQACAAKPQAVGGSREMIGERLDEVKAAVSPGNSSDWLARYYQFANRLATLWFLLEHGIEARLLHLCFLGDDHFPDAARDAGEWQGAGAEWAASTRWTAGSGGPSRPPSSRGCTCSRPGGWSDSRARVTPHSGGCMSPTWRVYAKTSLMCVSDDSLGSRGCPGRAETASEARVSSRRFSIPEPVARDGWSARQRNPRRSVSESERPLTSESAASNAISSGLSRTDTMPPGAAPPPVPTTS